MKNEFAGFIQLFAESINGGSGSKSTEAKEGRLGGRCESRAEMQSRSHQQAGDPTRTQVLSMVLRCTQIEENASQDSVTTLKPRKLKPSCS